MKHLTKLQQKQQGQSRSQAKGAKRLPVVVKGLGIAIADALEKQGETVRAALVNVIGNNQETVLQAMVEVKARRDQRIKECKGERKQKQIASVRVQFSRITVILRAIYDKVNLERIGKAISFAEMYAFASNKSKNPGKRSAKPYSKKQFATWHSGLKRIVGNAPGKTAKKSEVDTFGDQLARLERTVLDSLGQLVQFSTHTRIPVRDMLGLTAKRKQHLRKAA